MQRRTRLRGPTLGPGDQQAPGSCLALFPHWAPVSPHLVKGDKARDRQGSPHPGPSFYTRREEDPLSSFSLSLWDLEGPEGHWCVLCPSRDPQDKSRMGHYSHEEGTGTWWQ